jgi:hypothetical protein
MATLEIDQPADIAIADIDELRDTRISIGCYRETHRLERVLRTFRKALTLARKDKLDGEFLSILKGLHDHKGTLTATWSDATRARYFLRYINLAWENENECCLVHQDEDGDAFDECC